MKPEADGYDDRVLRLMQDVTIMQGKKSGTCCLVSGRHSRKRNWISWAPR
jgi:hypothetical protein